MPVPGHRQSPPDKGKTKSRSNNKVTTAVFPYTTFRFGKKTITKKALRTSFFYQQSSAPNRKPLPMKNHVRKKYQSRSSDLHSQAKQTSLLSFPMTGFRLRLFLECIQRLVSSRILTVFPFHRLYLLIAVRMALCVGIKL